MSRLHTLLVLASVGACRPDGPCEQCVLEDRHNFTYTSSLDAAAVEVAEARDLSVSWDGLETDLRGRPSEVGEAGGQVAVLLFPQLSRAQVLEGLAADSLTQDAIGGWFLCEPEGASCPLSDFCLDHTCLDPAEHFTADRGTWMLMLREAGTQEVLSLLFLDPSVDSEVLEVAIDDDSAQLEVVADLASADALAVPTRSELQLDWSALSVDGQGLPLALHRLDVLELARFDQDLPELEEQFLRLDELSSTRWSLDIEGRIGVDLEELGPDGFGGMDPDGTWLLALRCSGCNSPVPKVIVRLTATAD